MYYGISAKNHRYIQVQWEGTACLPGGGRSSITEEALIFKMRLEFMYCLNMYCSVFMESEGNNLFSYAGSKMPLVSLSSKHQEDAEKQDSRSQEGPV